MRALLLLAQLAVTVSAPDTVRLHGVLNMNVRVASAAGRSATLVPPLFRPFELVRSTARGRVETDLNGTSRTITDYRYTLRPSRLGSFVVPPFSARLDNAVAHSSPVRVVVSADTTGRGSLPGIVTRAQVDSGALITFRALVLPETVYVGQQATYQLGVFLDESVRDRLRRMEAIAPEMRGVMAYDAPLPTSGFPTRIVGGRHYDAHVYERAIFPLAPGRIVIPPARLVYAMPLTHSFFSREETFELRSDSVVLLAIDPPVQSRPADYTGAVGSVRIDAHVDSAVARVGNPTTLTLRIQGQGNVKLFPRPPLTIPWATVLPADERVTLAPDSLHIGGTKEFDWIVTPLRDGQRVLPPIRYVFFNPVARAYQTALSAPETLSVAAGTLVATDSGGPAVAPRLPLRTRYRGALAPPVYSRHALWWLLGFAPVPALALSLVRRPRRERRRGSRARTLRALSHSGADSARMRDVRRALLAAVAERLRVSAIAIAEPVALERVARRAGTSLATASAAASLLRELNAVAFGNENAEAARLAGESWRVYRAIDSEAVRESHHGAATLALLLAVLGSASLLRAAPLSEDATTFTRALGEYEHSRFASAERDFGAVAARSPRAPDAWANLGTAAWAAGDSAHAALGWQRALRLEPSAPDLRERLDLLSASGGNTLAVVPSVPPLPIALLAAALWLAVWAFAARAAWRRRRGMAWGIVGGAALAVAIGIGAWQLDATLAARDLVVVGLGTALRSVPALGSERQAPLPAGTIARVAERRAGWSRLVVDAEHEGWAESEALLSLARD